MSDPVSDEQFANARDAFRAAKREAIARGRARSAGSLDRATALQLEEDFIVAASACRVRELEYERLVRSRAEHEGREVVRMNFEDWSELVIVGEAKGV